MKRIVCSILCLALLLPLSACGETEYERIPLTVDNYEEYVHIDIYLTDYYFVITDQETSVGPMGTVSCVLHVETSKNSDCTFEDVFISYTLRNTSVWNFSNGIGSPYGSPENLETTLDFEGDSHISIIATIEKMAVTDMYTIGVTSSYWAVSSIQGYVVVPKKSK